MADEEKKPLREPPGATGMVPNKPPGGVPDMPPPGDAPMPLGPGGPGPGEMNGGPEPLSEPYGAQVLRHLHGLKRDILEEFDRLLEPLENERVKGFLEQYLQFVESTLTKAEQLFAKEYKELDPLEGAMTDAPGSMGDEEGKSKKKPPQKGPPKKPGDSGEKKGKEKTKEEPKKDKKDDKKPKESEKVKEARKKFLEVRREDILDRLRARRKDMGIEGPGTEKLGDGVVREDEAGSGSKDEELLNQIMELLNQIGSDSEEDGYMPEPPDERKRMDMYHYSKLLRSRKGSKDMGEGCSVLDDLAGQLESLAGERAWGEPHRQKVKELISVLKDLLTSKEESASGVEEGSEEMDEMKGAANATFNKEPGDVEQKRLVKMADDQAKMAKDLEEKAKRLSLMFS